MKSNNVALAIVIKQKRVLIQHRFRPKKGMCFEFPGGRVDPGESPQQAAQRELHEETGIQESTVHESYTRTNQWGGCISYVILGVHDDVEAQSIDTRRQQSFYWFQLNEIPIADFLPADQDFIQKHLSQYIT